MWTEAAAGVLMECGGRLVCWGGVGSGWSSGWLVANETKSKQISARQQTQRAAQGRRGEMSLSWVCLWGRRA